MAYISTLERMAIEEGMEKGMEKNKQDVALRLLKEGLAIKLIAKVTQLTPKRLKLLQKEAH